MEMTIDDITDPKCKQCPINAKCMTCPVMMQWVREHKKEEVLTNSKYCQMWVNILKDT